jgi:crotonyl-CoA carboxylase/reductase
MAQDLYDIGHQPSLGELPKRMHAWVIRPERFGQPRQAFQREVIEVPAIADEEVLVYGVKIGDEVVIHCGRWSRHCPWVKMGNDPMYSPTFRIWGYETNWGSFAQFTKVQAQSQGGTTNTAPIMPDSACSSQ